MDHQKSIKCIRHSNDLSTGYISMNQWQSNYVLINSYIHRGSRILMGLCTVINRRLCDRSKACFDASIDFCCCCLFLQIHTSQFTEIDRSLYDCGTNNKTNAFLMMFNDCRQEGGRVFLYI